MNEEFERDETIEELSALRFASEEMLNTIAELQEENAMLVDTRDNLIKGAQKRDALHENLKNAARELRISHKEWTKNPSKEAAFVKSACITRVCLAIEALDA